MSPRKPASKRSTRPRPAPQSAGGLRALVLSGGGARGVFEAGVLHALAAAELPFDILAGSSIGAINCAFFAEYLARRRQGESSDALSNRLHAYLSVWEDLEAARVVDFDSPRIANLVKDLSDFNLAVGDVLRVGWALTGGGGLALLAPGLRIARELAGELRLSAKDYVELLRDVAAGRAAEGVRRELLEGYVRFLRRHGIEKGLFPTDELAAAFSRPRPADGGEAVELIPAGRRLSTYAAVGLEVRFTRANLRNGRIEFSAFAPAASLFTQDGQIRPASQLKIVGDPDVISAALASGAFPFVFPPVPLERIYPAAPGERGTPNALLRALADGPAAARAYLRAAHGVTLTDEGWRALAAIYPQAGDVYIDGGAIDNTPLGSAIAAARDLRAERLEILVVMLDEAPQRREISREQTAALTAPEIGLRGLHFLTTSTVERDAAFAEALTGKAMRVNALIGEIEAAAGRLPAARRRRLRAQIDAWQASGLLPVEVTRIWPEKLPMGVLTFDRRVGYNRDKARQALVDGCASTLAALYQRWAPADPARLDPATRAARERLLGFVRTSAARPAPGMEWRCANLACRFRDACSKAR